MNTPKSQPERRKYARTKASVQLELRTEASDVPIRVETTDISVTGCYVEMSITLEVGTKLAIGLWLGNRKVTTAATVVTRHPQFGNGIEFLDMVEQDRSALRQYLELKN